ncbi:polymer-forming cytoskeletal protein [Pontiella agarivorans]|uniref:Polymer-forming cytoskeletal protein n=1 Tax=Pontiella agarivorans TaxID=3038953 RepID=A0ABU5MXB4_9BACT|nr:polymer-forming cytoskeletal protein [Pontiella agarivorans]MDZ8118853.1 polymer-forming cytoskeletal protein [Pontiella agarivorans]
MPLKPFFSSLVLCAALQAQAAIPWISTNMYAVSLGTSVENEQWVYADQADVSGTFGNDLFIGTAAPLQLAGIYQGNVLAATLTAIEQTGSCERNLRIYSPTIKVDGGIAGNLLAAGNTIVLGTNAYIHGNAHIYGAMSIVQEGHIEGNVDVSAQTVTFAGTILGNVSVRAQDIVFAQGARIEGDFEYSAPKKLFLDGDVIGGSVSTPPEPELFDAGRLKKILISFVAAILVGIPFLTLFPMTTAMSTQLIKRSPGKCILVGLMASLGLPLFGLMSFSSLIGVPLGMLLLGSWAAMVYLSRILLALVIGNLILKKAQNSLGKVIGAVSAGLAVIYGTAVFPIIGIPVQIIVLLLGMGSFIIALIEKRRLILQVPSDLHKLQKLRDENYNPEENEK